MSNVATRTEPSTAPAEVHQLLREENVEAAALPEEELEERLWKSDYLSSKIHLKSPQKVNDELKGSDELGSWNDTSVALDDNGPRHSYKGPPPELYSPKKEYIYTRPLVEKQLVLKKTIEWWLYKNKYSRSMSTHWRQQACIIISSLIIALILFGGIIFLISRAPSKSDSNRVGEIQLTSQFINDTINDTWSEESDIKSDDFGGIEDIGDDKLSDFVTPRKVHNFTLNAEDLLYESRRNNDGNGSKRDAISAFSMTGTFRSKLSEIWDPHPEYELYVFGQSLHIVLHQDTSFIPTNTFKVIRILNNQTEQADDEEQVHYLGCYYKGYVDGDNQSAVAVSLCSGMTGYIKTGFGTLLIQPVNQTSSDEILHRVWRHSQRNPRHAVSDLDLELEALELVESVQPRKTRSKRHFLNTGNQVYTLEVLIAVDNTMVEFHKNDLTSYILILFSIVSNIFADASIGNSIRISLVNLMKLSDSIPSERSGNRRGTSEKLKHSCTFLSKKGYHYDTAMLITRNQICGNEREERCSTLGLAELGTVCKAQSCSIVQDNGLPAAFTIAHELGHILNMPHDDDDRCKGYNTNSGNNRTLHIMSSVMGDHMHPWSWSKCSQHYVSEFLEKTDKSCLENTPSTSMQNLNTKQPGEIYSLDQQCKLIHGNRSTHCSFETECRRLFCTTNSRSNEPCRSSNLPWADGTPCNNNRYWCQKGNCVHRMGGSLQVVHGGWGPWAPFTPCSLTCGGGVQESRRECNNPVAQNGGKYCVGSRKKYRSCNTHSCPFGTVDPREQQCYDMNGRNMKIQGISPASKWIPKYGLKSEDKCILYCRLEDDSAYFRLKETVTDGTTCDVDSFDKCVNGICRPAGCDNELNSIAKLDKCGVCEGRNDTCVEHTGNVYVSDLLKQKKDSVNLYYVTTIPKGASNIIITQPGYPDQNYIVLRTDTHGDLLNSGKVVLPYPKKYSYAGVTIDYNGAIAGTIERVNTTYSWKLKRDLIVEIISIDLSAAKNQNTILISYTYTLDKPSHSEQVEIYRWQMESWSKCDSLCQGSMHRLPTCISTILGDKVPPQLCEESAKPKVEYRSCNTDCILTLNTTSISECSAACGELGVREKIFNCVQTFPDIQRSNIVDMSFCQSKFEIVTHEHCREGCWNYTDWSTCTKTCGTGTQVRELRCYLNQTPVSHDLCNPRTKYELKEPLRTCNMEPCRPEVSINTRSVSHWVADEWGECSNWCKMNRTVTCTHPYGNHCPLDKKPKEVRNCCNIKYTSEWGKCSVECGTGTKRKVQRCTRVYKPEVPGTPKRRVYIEDSFCKTLKVRKPIPRKSTKLCTAHCQWVTSNWNRCSKDCAEEYQKRFVRCEVWRGNIVSDHHCESKPRPSSKQICKNCVRQRYKVISPCDCLGHEKRRISYYDSQRRRVLKPKIEKYLCKPPPNCRRRSLSSSPVSSSIPSSISSSIGSSSSISSSSSSSNSISNSRDSSRNLNSLSVRRPQSCADLQTMHGIYKDGEYMLQVHSRQVQIYCYQMNSVAPREYITVEPRENYSIYYEYKTRLIDSCPPISRDHEYANDQNSGRTHFSKLRLNITTLRLVENDFEFAESRGQRQALGSAGDCYNRNRNCPQGDFSISLDRTGFTMLPGTVWNMYGSRPVMQRSSGFEQSAISRRAFCGGYCGRCSVSPTAGLYVEVV